MKPFMETGNMRKGASPEQGGRLSKYKVFNIDKYRLAIRSTYDTSFLRQNLIFYLFYRKTICFPWTCCFGHLKSTKFTEKCEYSMGLLL